MPSPEPADGPDDSAPWAAGIVAEVEARGPRLAPRDAERVLRVVMDAAQDAGDAMEGIEQRIAGAGLGRGGAERSYGAAASGSPAAPGAGPSPPGPAPLVVDRADGCEVDLDALAARAPGALLQIHRIVMAAVPRVV
jgi:hypothetical protein